MSVWNLFVRKKNTENIDEILKGVLFYVAEVYHEEKPEVEVYNSIDVDAKNEYCYSTSLLDSKHRKDTEELDKLISAISKKLREIPELDALDEYRNQTFTEKLFSIINEKDLSDVSVYKGAQLDRRLFSKIMSDTEYQPSKDTAVAIAFSLKLNQEETEDLLQRAGFVLSHSNRRDIIIEYFFRNKKYDLDIVNEVLVRAGEKKIGR